MAQNDTAAVHTLDSGEPEVGDPRAFWTYWSASTTSGVGSAMTTVAMPLVAVLILHAGAVEMGVLTAAGDIAWLVVGLPAGAIVQWLALRRLQVGLDLLRAVAILSIPLAWWLDGLTLAHLVIVALVVSFANVFFFVANSTFLPSVVPKSELHARNSLMSGTHATTQLSGPSVAGLLVQAIGAVPTLLVDAASYLVSATLLQRLPERRQPGDRTEVGSLRRQMREGWDFVRHHPVMNACMWDATITNFVCGGQLALFAVYLVQSTRAPAGLVGFLLAAEGVGSLIGSALSPRIVRSLGSARACIVYGFVSVVGALTIPLGAHVTAWILFAVGNIVFALGVVVLSTATRTFRQTATPPELLSRVMATVRFVSWGAIPLGALTAGMLGHWLGLRPALFVLGAVTIGSPLVLLCSPVRHLRNLDDPVV
ncbi:MFS transporter [Flexivirga sp. B27]